MRKWLRYAVTGWRRWLLLCGCAILNACTDTRLTAGEVYLLRLGDALQLDIRIAEQPGPQAFPHRRDLLIDVPRQDISVVEFARLHRCDMGGLIGARNSGLGRLGGAGERLRYELKWLAAARPCMASGETWLAGFLTEKRATLPAIVWNATIATAEFNTAMGTTGAAVRSDFTAMQALAAVIPKLHEEKLHEGKLHEDRHRDLQLLDATVDELALALRNLAAQTRVGQRVQSWHHMVVVLEAATTALAARQARICLSGQPTLRMQRLARVFQVYYVARWQALFAPRLARDRQWLQALQKIAQLSSAVETPAFADWFMATVAADNNASLWRRLHHALQSHAQVWQQLLASCGMRVTDLREDQ